MIKYSPGINHSKTSIINYQNRGMSFENEINISNEYYRINRVAFIYKKPTPIKIVRAVNYNNSYKIVEAYFSSPSTTDYNGIFNGFYIDFEAKETKSITSFPFSNIHKNQIEHLFNIIDSKGIAFLLIRFIRLNSVYLLKAETLRDLINDGKKSIKVETIKKEGYLVPSLYNCPINYLEIVKRFLL